MKILSICLFLLLLIFIEIIAYLLLKKYVFNYFFKSLQKKTTILLAFIVEIIAGIFILGYFMYIWTANLPVYIIYRSYYLPTSILFIIFSFKFSVVISFGLMGFVKFIFGKLYFERNTEKIKIKKLLNYGFLTIGSMFIFIFNFFILYGIIAGPYDIRINYVEVPVKNLPKSFHNIRIVQISDMHLGSFSNISKTRENIEKINQLHPDILVITGDIINVESDEMLPYIDAIKIISTKFGKFACLGNHDIGDYRRWGIIKTFLPDMQKLKENYANMQVKLLIDSSFEITHDNDTLTIVGVNNIGVKPFKKSGNLQKALKNVNKNKPIILLSHDPSHWEYEVSKIKEITLTLSGHTHAMQFGINFYKWFWSPIALRYPYWNGKYSSKNNYLYVNRGFGYLGFIGRIGMYPEISVITLKSNTNQANN